MNAAARVITQANFFTGQLTEMKLSKQLCFVLFMSFLVLCSALAVVYVRNEHRVTFSQYEQFKQQTNQLQLQWGQLLLEQASLATPARVQAMAEEKLHMLLPSDKQIFVLEAQ